MVITIINLAVTALGVFMIAVYRRGEKTKPASFRATGALAVWVSGCAVIRAWTILTMHDDDWTSWVALAALIWVDVSLAKMAWDKRMMPR